MGIFSKSDKTVIDPSHYNDYYFTELGVSRESAMKLYDTLAKGIGIDTKDYDVFYRPAWCALKLAGFNPENILEIGTYKGYSAVLLSLLWPESHIYTVDLPQNDPLFYKGRPEPENQSPLLYTSPNITVIKANSMHVQQTEIKDLPVDLLFIDAGHNNPTMSFDHLYWLDHVRPGGWVFSDDVWFPGDPLNKKTNVIWETIKYINDRSDDKFRFLLQREDEKRFKEDAKRGVRKYVAFVRKSK